MTANQRHCARARHHKVFIEPYEVYITPIRSTFRALSVMVRITDSIRNFAVASAMSLLAIGSASSADFSHAGARKTQVIWQALKSTEVNGFRTGMSIKEVASRITLRPLGNGDFQASGGGTTYGFGFTPLGRLYRIDSAQPLGRFVPDHATARELTARLTAKFGEPNQNQLPGGPAAWTRYMTMPSPDGRRQEARQAQTLSVMFQGGRSAQVELWIKLVDFSILWEDNARINASPKTRAEDAIRF